ncbi:MAG: hypothetical protein Ta2G_08070 [Termitinemataceae bacterium]|nr:MAG: hypothetical protein Ta2G_08070 [Termitinemataceae bacterium]
MIDGVNLGNTPLLNTLLQSNLNQNTKRTDEKQKIGEKEKAGKSNIFSKLIKKTITDNELLLANIDPSLPAEQIVEILLDSVHSAGDELQKHPFSQNVKKYKEAVKRFINYIVENSYDVKEDIGIANRDKPQFKNVKDPDKRRQQNVYKNLAVIDQKLDKLAADVLMMQGSQLKILSSVEEIYGLLVDMLQ